MYMYIVHVHVCYPCVLVQSCIHVHCASDSAFLCTDQFCCDLYEGVLIYFTRGQCRQFLSQTVKCGAL